MPRTMTYLRLRAELRSVLDEVCNDRDVVYVARQSGGDIVILSREEYESLDATAHLLGSPANARRLEAALHRSGSERLSVDLDELKRRVLEGDQAPESSAVRSR
jgi:antitoxin YefM